MDDGGVHQERAPGNEHVLLVTIDRPPVNALNLATYRKLLAVFEQLRELPDIRCVVLTGRGQRAFIGGSDVKELGALTPESTLERSRIGRRTFDAIRRSPVPVIGAVNGPALGSGLVIASVCDVIIAADTATFALPEINVGVMGGTRHLARIVPDKVMRRMAFTGAKISAEYLARFGGVHEIVPALELMAAALALAGEIAAKSPAAVRLMKEVINLTEEMNLNEGYHVEQFCTAIISSHPDSKEAAKAFFEKRDPVFQ